MSFTLFNLEGTRQESGAADSVVGGIAQLGEHLLCKQGVIGSSPIISTTYFLSRKKVGKESFHRAYRDWIEAFTGVSVSIWP